MSSLVDDQKEEEEAWSGQGGASSPSRVLCKARGGIF